LATENDDELDIFMLKRMAKLRGDALTIAGARLLTLLILNSALNKGTKIMNEVTKKYADLFLELCNALESDEKSEIMEKLKRELCEEKEQFEVDPQETENPIPPKEENVVFTGLSADEILVTSKDETTDKVKSKTIIDVKLNPDVDSPPIKIDERMKVGEVLLGKLDENGNVKEATKITNISPENPVKAEPGIPPGESIGSDPKVSVKKTIVVDPRLG
jgi:hypothetical protein